MRLLIVEDEPLIAQRLERYCRELLGETLSAVQRVAEFDAAQTWLQEHPIDVLLLDLNLAGADGMELLQLSVARSFHTIIVSANTDEALRAFEFGVIDFVPKPFSRERLGQALQRATTVDGRAPRAARRVAVRKLGRVELVDVDDIIYVQGAGNYSELVLTDGRRELHDKTLERLAAVLPADFERVHRSFLVRMSAVRALHAREGSHYEAELRNGARLPIGRQRYKAIRERLA
ncbi:MAG TPA: LytTR family DNA-binding domain-containing protein [Candidatus Synoicihabitans sp.]|nr:LytTR family DNA-binding domain-containing protein [Candidatus Synoicihabitans sp.]